MSMTINQSNDVETQRGRLEGLKGWVFSDGKAGNDAQSLGIAHALGLDTAVKHIAPRGIQKVFAPWWPVSGAEKFGEAGGQFAPPWPDVAFSIGRLTTPYLRALKQRAGAKTFTVILQDPKVSPRTADLFWVPEHDILRGPNVITTLTAPHRFSPQWLEERRTSVPEAIAALPHPRIAVMLGGSNGDYIYDEQSIGRLCRVLKRLAALGAGLMITPSRRSDPQLVAGVRAATQDTACYFWDMEAPNPYPDFLAHADVFLAPGDSVNMTGEPLVTGRPVYVFHPTGGSPKFRRFHEALERYGATRPLPVDIAELPTWSYPPLYSTGIIAREIAERVRAARGMLE